MGEKSSDNIVPSANDESNFLFGLNDYAFSDRILRLEIIQDDGNNPIHSYKKIKNTHIGVSDQSSDGVKLTILHINSLILAAKSPFFYKLFTNGMRESQNKDDVSLTIKASEETTLMDLLRFMYGKTLSSNSAHDLVDLLIISDKFEVHCCTRHCVEMLLKQLPMSLESALLYLEIPPCVLVSEIVKPLVKAAKQYLGTHYKDFTKSAQREAMELPLSALKVVLGSEGFKVASEDDVFDFVVEWARAFYPDIEERREILTNHLARFIHFPNMSGPKLNEVLDCADFDQGKASKLVMEALFSKVEVSCGQHVHASMDLADGGCSTRAYLPHCVVFFDLKRDELKSLSSEICSQSFCVGGTRFYLQAQRCVGEEQLNHLGLFILMEQGTKTCTLDLEFSVMDKSSNEFQIKGKSNNCTFIGAGGFGSNNLLKMTWTELMSDDNQYFINDILHFRVHVTLQSYEP